MPHMSLRRECIHSLDLFLVLLRKVGAASQAHHRFIVLPLHGRRVCVLLEQPLPGQPNGEWPILRLQLHLEQWTGHPQTEDALRQQLVGDAELLAAERSGQHHLGGTLSGAVDLHVHGNARHQVHAGGYDLRKDIWSAIIILACCTNSRVYIQRER